MLLVTVHWKIQLLEKASEQNWFSKRLEPSSPNNFNWNSHKAQNLFLELALPSKALNVSKHLIKRVKGLQKHMSRFPLHFLWNGNILKVVPRREFVVFLFSFKINQIDTVK